MKEKRFDLSLDGIKASLVYLMCEGFKLNMLLVGFEEKRRVLSTKEAYKEVKFVGNTYIDGALFEHVRKSFGERLPVNFDLGIDRKVLKILGIAPDEAAILNTAVNMEHVAVHEKSYKEFKVCCFVTAGTRGNALRTGEDTADWTERNGIYANPLGTINIIVLTNAKLADSAMARAIITATEAKTAALQDLDIRSTLNPKKQATGTGTDNIIIVSGVEFDEPIQCTSGHTKMGELIAVSTKEAVTQAMKKHDGTLSVRSLFRFAKKNKHRR
ncbi:MAG: hypothetical protein CW691_07575 [Candidatus Bathyarchaeum sp.]|nr:MAG: hypothetical protein CW691_07575 [Candidatus Bathyarchaeum sp.]